MGAFDNFRRGEHKRRKFVRYFSANSYKPTKNHYAEEVRLRRRYFTLVLLTLGLLLISSWGILNELLSPLIKH